MENEAKSSNEDHVTARSIDANTEKEAKANFLKQNLERHIATFKKKRKANQKKAFVLKILASIFAVAITILLGIKVNDVIKGYFSNIALILGGTITVLNAWDAFYNYRALWVRYTVTMCQLYGVQADLEYLLTSDLSSIDVKRIDELYEQYQNILDETNEIWRTLRKEESKQTPK